MTAIIMWGLLSALICAMAYCITHKGDFDAVQADTDEYRFSTIFNQKYGGTFRASGYKLKHNAVMFVRPTKDADLWQAGDVLVVDTEFDDFVRDRLYLFVQGRTYRITRCIATDRIGSFPPIFDGHETLITHKCLGCVIGKLEPPDVKLF